MPLRTLFKRFAATREVEEPWAEFDNRRQSSTQGTINLSKCSPAHVPLHVSRTTAITTAFRMAWAIIVGTIRSSR